MLSVALTGMIAVHPWPVPKLPLKLDRGAIEGRSIDVATLFYLDGEPVVWDEIPQGAVVVEIEAGLHRVIALKFRSPKKP